MDRFDLKIEEWFPVQDTRGRVRPVGLEEVMLRAHELGGVEGESPLETVSLYRLLVGLAHHLLEDFSSPGEWAEKIWVRGRFDEEKVRCYFRESWADRFGLFDASFPFWQCPGLVNIDDPKTEGERPVLMTTLLPPVASGNNKTLFSHRIDSDALALSPAEAARALVTAQYFDLGGLNKKTSNYFGYQKSFYHAPFVAGMPSIVMGDTLFETIALNMLPGQSRGGALGNDLGRPPWAEPPEQIGKNEKREKTPKNPTTPQSYLEYLLPRSRHLRLEPYPASDGSVLVRHMHIAQGVGWDASVEPWFVRVEDPKKNTTGPLSLNPDRAVWRNSAAYLGWRSGEQDKQKSSIPPDNLRAYGSFRHALRSSPDRQPPPLAPLAVFALANDKSKFLAWRHETLDLPVEAMNDERMMKDIKASLNKLEEVAGILRGGVRRFYREALRNEEAGRDALPNKKAASSAALRTYWGCVEQPFRKVLVGESASWACIQACIDAARSIFEQTMNAVVGTDLRLFPARAQAEGQFNGSLKKLKDEKEDDS